MFNFLHIYRITFSLPGTRWCGTAGTVTPAWDPPSQVLQFFLSFIRCVRILLRSTSVFQYLPLEVFQTFLNNLAQVFFSLVLTHLSQGLYSFCPLVSSCSSLLHIVFFNHLSRVLQSLSFSIFLFMSFVFHFKIHFSNRTVSHQLNCPYQVFQTRSFSH